MNRETRTDSGRASTIWPLETNLGLVSGVELMSCVCLCGMARWSWGSEELEVVLANKVQFYHIEMAIQHPFLRANSLFDLKDMNISISFKLLKDSHKYHSSYLNSI